MAAVLGFCHARLSPTGSSLASPPSAPGNDLELHLRSPPTLFVPGLVSAPVVMHVVYCSLLPDALAWGSLWCDRALLACGSLLFCALPSCTPYARFLFCLAHLLCHAPCDSCPLSGVPPARPRSPRLHLIVAHSLLCTSFELVPSRCQHRPPAPLSSQASPPDFSRRQPTAARGCP